MKIVAGEGKDESNSGRKLWGLWLAGSAGGEGCLVAGGHIRGTEDYTPKHVAKHIEKCVNAFANAKDVDAAIKEFMEWQAEKALTTSKVEGT